MIILILKSVRNIIKSIEKGNKKCFDVFSIRDEKQLNIDNGFAHQIDATDFPKNISVHWKNKCA